MKTLIAPAAVVFLAVAAAAQEPSLKAKLVDPERKAQQGSATVEVEIAGIKMIDPAVAKEQPKKGQGHLHYQVDDGLVIATTATKLSFHGLTTGKHTVKVMLAGNDHAMLGPSETLEVTVP